MATSDKQRKRAEPAHPPAKRRQETLRTHPRQEYTEEATLLPSSETLSIGPGTPELESAIDALRESEDELAGIYENAPLIMLLVDEACRLRKVNRHAAQVARDDSAGLQGALLGAALRCVEALNRKEGCGFSPGCDSCLVRRKVLDTLHNGSDQRTVEANVPVLFGGSARTMTFLVSTSKVLIRNRPHVLLTLQDITERKQVEAALKASESALRQAQHLVALGTWEWNIQTGQHSWSEEIYRIYGCDTTLPPVVYPDVKRYFTSESWESLSGAVERALREGAAYQCDAEVVRPDGARRWVTARGQATRDGAGKIIGLQATVQDITERKLSEQRIAQLNRAQAILAAVDHAIVHIHDRQQLLDEICRVAADKGGFKLVWIGMVAPDGTVQPVSAAGETEYLQGIRVVVHDEPAGRGPVGSAIRENRPVVIEDVEHDPRMRLWRDRARQFGLRYVAAFPIQVAGKSVGSMQLYAPRAGFFDESELSLVTQVSNDISFALTAIQAIAERKRAEQELRKSEQELVDFFEASPLGMLWVNSAGRILRANRAELELLGRTSDEVLGCFIADFHVEPEVAWDVLKRMARKETLQNHRARLRHRDGAIKYVLIDANGYWEGEQLVHSRWFVRDITHRIELEREILTISEREQRRLGHDLHDDLCQQLAGIEFLSQTLASDLAAKAGTEAVQAKEIAQSVQHAMAQTRELARGLSPVGMEAEGLMEGLRQLAERTCKVFRLECQLRCPTSVLVPDHAVAIHLYRIAQEAVGNAIKHGKAERVTIALTAVGNSLRLGVTDDGIGIPRKRPRAKGMGLRIMQYRAGVIGGSLAVQRHPNGGTTVVCTVAGGLLPASARSAG